MINAEDKTYENETRSLKNIIDSKEAEITSYQSNQMALYAEVKKLKNENDPSLDYSQIFEDDE